MEDLNSLSDEQLLAIVNEAKPTQPQPQEEDLNSLSDEQLQAIAGTAQPAEDTGLLARISEAVTGKARSTPTIEALPDWRGNMPEFSLSQGLPALKTAFATMSTNPDETAKIVKAQFPDVELKQDEKGNYIFKSGIDGKDYALKPGLTFSDIPRGIVTALQFLPSGRATGLIGAGLAAGATQAAIEATQAAAGGEFNPEEVGVAAGMGVGGEALSKILGVAIPGARRVLQGKSFIPEEIASTVPAVSQEVAQVDLETLINKASSESLSANKYKRQLAQAAKVNPEAMAAAESLGIELPPDAFSDNPQLRELVGANRAIKGSEASLEWRTAVQDAVAKADQALEKIEGATDVSTISDKVLASLKADRDALKAETKAAYDEVDAAIPASTVVSQPIKKEAVIALSPEEQQAKQLEESLLKATGKYIAPEAAQEAEKTVGLPNLKALLEETVKNVGGVSGLRPQEQELLNMVKNEKVTYGRFIREKNDLRKTLRGQQTPYSNLDQNIVKGLYDALTKDQLNAVEQLAGSEMRDRLASANLLYTKQKQLESTLVDAFGKDFNGSLSSMLRGAVSGGKVGNVTMLNKLLETVPKPLQKEAVLSSIFGMTRGGAGEFSQKFGIQQFNNVWNALSAQPKVLSKIQQVIGSEAFGTLSSLGKVSKYIDASIREISRNGASLQALARGSKMESFLDRVLGQKFLTFAGGQLGGGVGAVIAQQFARAPKDRLLQMTKMLNSSEFQDIAKGVMQTSVPSKTAITRFAESLPFKKLAAMSNLPLDVNGKVKWIKAALMSAHDMAQPQSAFHPDKVVAEVLPNGTVKSDPTTKFKIVQKPGGKYRLLAPDGTVSVHSTEQEAIKTATKKLRILTNSPLK